MANLVSTECLLQLRIKGRLSQEGKNFIPKHFPKNIYYMLHYSLVSWRPKCNREIQCWPPGWKRTFSSSSILLSRLPEVWVSLGWRGAGCLGFPPMSSSAEPPADGLRKWQDNTFFTESFKLSVTKNRVPGEAENTSEACNCWSNNGAEVKVAKTKITFFFLEVAKWLGVSTEVQHRRCNKEDMMGKLNVTMSSLIWTKLWRSFTKT